LGVRDLDDDQKIFLNVSEMLSQTLFFGAGALAAALAAAFLGAAATLATWDAETFATGGVTAAGAGVVAGAVGVIGCAGARVVPTEGAVATGVGVGVGVATGVELRDPAV
jgi:hypothetical protein